MLQRVYERVYEGLYTIYSGFWMVVLLIVFCIIAQFEPKEPKER